MSNIKSHFKGIVSQDEIFLVGLENQISTFCTCAVGREESCDRNSYTTSDQYLLFYLESISVFKEERRKFIYIYFF
jgi:hypothetical protein